MNTSPLKRSFISLLVAIGISPWLAAWENHPLITAEVASTAPALTEMPLAVAAPLEDFLLAVESDLAVFLAEEEAWLRDNLKWYAPRPDALAFVATGNRNDIVQRFFQAIRINPHTKAPLYLCTLKGDLPPGQPTYTREEVALLPNTAGLDRFDLIQVAPGAAVSPLAIVATASNEPDFGMDTLLFSNNGSPFGAAYGFGDQPFGNPNLDYGSQAPFHMGYYHESFIVYWFAGFLKKTYPEYRIHLYKSLSEFAFHHGHPYWGLRFMGWGLHYLADLSMPYHTTVMPNRSTFGMLWINLLDILGLHKPMNHAVQLLSNRHMAMERYQRLLMEQAVREHNTGHAFLQALSSAETAGSYSDAMPREEISRQSHKLARKIDKTLVKYMPSAFVDDPAIELADRPDLDGIVDMVTANHGGEAVAEINSLMAEALSIFGYYGRSFILEILR